MTHSLQSDTRESFFGQIQAYLSDHQVPGDHEKLLKFSRIYYAYLSIEELFSRPLESWVKLLITHWSLLNTPSDAFFKLSVEVTEDSLGMPLTQIYVVSCDMPFLVDSLSLELNRLHLNVDLLLHSAGFRVIRGKEEQIDSLWAYQDHSEEGESEAVLYFEIKKAMDEEDIAHLKTNLERVLHDVHVAVNDWLPMQGEVHRAIARLDNAPSCLARDKVEEAKAFLSWLLENFVFTGFRSYDVIGEGDSMAFQLNPNSGLGVLRDNTNSLRLRYVQDLPKQARQKLLSSDDIVLVAKTNTISTIHRKTYTDYVSVSVYNDDKQVIGELRFIGMFTSHAYAQDPKKVPILQRKVFDVLERADFPKHGHLWKDLVHIISSLPRDDLFHASADELNEWCQGILQIQDRYKTRFLYRQDVFNRFYSCLLFIPRDTLSMSLIYRIRDYLRERLNAKSIEHQTFLFGSVLARIHFEIRVDPNALVDVDMKEIESDIVRLTCSWGDQLSEAIMEVHSPQKAKRLIERYRQAFGVTYREHYSVKDAVEDFEHIERVITAGQLEVALLPSPKKGSAEDDTMTTCQFKLYSESSSIPLSKVLPILESMGVRVLSEFPVDVHVSPTQVVWITDFTLASDRVSLEELFATKALFEEAFKRVSSGFLCDDALNALVGKAGMSWRLVRVIRAYIKYCRQIRVPYSELYMASILIRYPAIVEAIMALFETRFNPDINGEREEKVAALTAQIDDLLSAIELLDEDRVLRKMLELVMATLRTNFYVKADNGNDKLFVTLKIDPTQLSDMSGCKTKIETFVYSALFEGIHLRVDKVARGGIRWSSRPEDYRTEVLGLVEAQLVKNAVIVPAGAKGGFVIHQSEDSFASMDELWAHGIQCYRYFIRGLLDVIDDLKEGAVVHHPQVICYDGDDPLAVVAADRRTATFSDYANSESESRAYWLGDAFASGGSNGYDHKKMGITARGAWVSAQRHFLEMGVNLDETEVRVVAIGDMSGDVFGNGMLLSQHIKLVAAFNHKHIFLDPNPDPKRSYEERKRLFELPRSGWNDYSDALISSGGGVFDRSQKSIALSDEVKAMLGLSQDEIEPNALIRALLCLDVDMLWNGGIGTYVKGGSESHDEVGDRANDALRVDAAKLRCKTICEGGNLGLTQHARIEYELHGGRVYCDFIDNSAGVDCSDHEVNIKILLNGLVAADRMTQEERNVLLESMSDEVAAHVLRNNYLQGLAVSDAKRHAAASPLKYAHYMDQLEQSGQLNRQAESLPDEATLVMRHNQGMGLMHPELSTLFAYTKIFIGNDLRKEDLLGNPDLTFYLQEAFPQAIRTQYAEELKSHYLANEIIATQLVNAMVADMGMLFVNQMVSEIGVTTYAVAKAYVAMSHIIHLRQRLAEVESLDHQISPELQFKMRSDIIRLARRVTRWILRHHGLAIDISQLVEAYEEPIGFLTHHLDSLVFKSSDKAYVNQAKHLEKEGVPEAIARHMSALLLIYHGMNIIAAAMQGSHDLLVVAKAYVLLSSRLDLVFLREKIDSILEDTEWSLAARSCCKVDLEIMQRHLALELLKNGTEGAPIEEDFQAWVKLRKEDLKRWRQRMNQLKKTQSVDSAIIFLAIRQLKEFAAEDTAFCAS